MSADRWLLLVVLNVAKQHSVSRGLGCALAFLALLQGWLCVRGLCALQFAKNSLGQRRQSF